MDLPAEAKTPAVETKVPCEPLFSCNDGTRAEAEIEVFLQEVAAGKKTPFQLDCDLVAILGHALIFASNRDADKVIAALVEHGASISEENVQRLRDAARAYGDRQKDYLERNPTQDHGDIDWVEAAYYDGKFERQLTERLAKVPVRNV